MGERFKGKLETCQDRTGEFAAQATPIAAHAFKTFYRPALAALYAGVGGFEIANGQYITGGALIVGSCGMLGVNYTEQILAERSRRSALFDAGRALGNLEASLMTNPIQTMTTLMQAERDLRSKEGTPLYTSLDGKIVITNGEQLLRSLGKDSDQVATRIGVILGHAKRRELKKDEIETLRRAKAAFEVVPQIKEVLCMYGQEMIDEMYTEISKYEPADPGTSA